MNKPEELLEESDSSDEDYVPENQRQEAVSEEESDGDPEDDASDTERGKKKRKRSKTNRTSKKKPKKTEDEKPVDSNELSEEEKKKQADDIWADFMKDTGFHSKKSNSEQTVTSKTNSTSINTSSSGDKVLKKQPEKVKVTQIFEFAGEEVAVEKEVSLDSAEARLFKRAGPESSSCKSKVKGLSGIGSILSQLGKKPKISTLEKSKLDWDKFKKEENIDEELQTHNKGKDGYLERQDFLQRADLRRFEIEREIRTIERNKRMNV